MRLHIPTGLTAVLVNLDQAVLALNCLNGEGEELVSASFRGRIEPAYRQLVALNERHAEVKHSWHQALTRRDRELGVLRRLVRDAWLMLRRRDQREGHEGLLTLHYQMPRLAPPHASVALWLQYARNLVAGEVRALAAGHAPMAYPSAAELAQSLALSERAETDYQELTLVLKDAETDLRQHQRLACHLLRRLAARLRERQFDQGPARTRALMRCFGFRFTATPGDDAEALAELAQSETPDASAAPGPKPVAEPALAAAKEAEPKGGETPRSDTTTPPRQEVRSVASSGTPWVETLRSWVRAPNELLKRYPGRKAS